MIRHRCDNPGCVRPDHLVAGTQADNIRDAHERGRHPITKLSSEAAAEIRQRAGSTTRRQLAREFGVSTGSIYNVIARRTWK